jgi:hypothetical protein
MVNFRKYAKIHVFQVDLKLIFFLNLLVILKQYVLLYKTYCIYIIIRFIIKRIVPTGAGVSRRPQGML